MKKKGLFLVVFTSVCLLLILFSYFAWSNSLASVTRPAEAEQPTSPSSEDTGQVEETDEATDETSTDFSTQFVNMDEAVRSVFEDRVAKGEVVNFLFLGSDLMEMGEPNMYTLVSEALTTTYDDSINISKQTFNATSLTVMNEDQISFEGEYDVILFEPFTLKNNGEVDMETEHAHVTSIVTSFREQVEDAAVVFTPPNPIYNATYYPVQVEGLKTYLDSRGYLLVDHWDNWPDPTDEAIKDYLDDQSRPNEQGAAAWADALIAYFTGTN